MLVLIEDDNLFYSSFYHYLKDWTLASVCLKEKMKS